MVLADLTHIQTHIASRQEKLRSHPMYGALQNLDDIRLFSESHVFAVFDFMSLLKTLQRQLTCVKTPWTPPEYPQLARFINEIVLEEETDLDAEGSPKSHYAMYIEAMEQLGANTAPIEELLLNADRGMSIPTALAQLRLDPRVRAFVEFTFEVIAQDKPHTTAAAFTFGREDVIPDMFLHILENAQNQDTPCDKFAFYLKRHIELDGDEHGPLSLKLVSLLNGDDADKWEETRLVAAQALDHRIQLWDAIHDQLTGKTSATSERKSWMRLWG